MDTKSRDAKSGVPSPEHSAAAPVLDWRQALADAVARATSTNDPRTVGLSAVADACVKAAMNGNIQAMKEIAAEFERPAADAPQVYRVVHTFKSPLSYWDEKDEP